MSAFIVHPRHIATCAVIIHEIIFEELDEHFRISNIRMHLALSNVISVAWRYAGEDSHAFLTDLHASLDRLAEIDFNTTSKHFPAITTDVNEACFDIGYSTLDYLTECREAEPQTANYAEYCQYLSCLDYQSSITPFWSENKASRWILECKAFMADRMASDALGKNHIWEVRDPRPTPMPA